MKRFCIACVGFSLLCVAFSCGQQAFKRGAQANQVSSGTLFVHATPVMWDGKGMKPVGPKGLLNLSHVTFIGNVQGTDNITTVPHMYSNSSSVVDDTYQIDVADVPK
jgi:hypothetical protein